MQALSTDTSRLGQARGHADGHIGPDDTADESSHTPKVVTLIHPSKRSVTRVARGSE